MSVADSGQAWCEGLYEAKAAQLLLYGRALGLSHNEAEDVLQDTFVALLALAEPPERPEHYAVRAFRNRALNHRRSLWRRLTRELAAQRWFDRVPDPSGREEPAMRGLAGLPGEQREVIVLKIWHSMTFDAIAELLALSPNTVAGRYRYGLRKLRTYLEKETYERVEPVGGPAPFLEAAPPFSKA